MNGFGQINGFKNSAFNYVDSAKLEAPISDTSKKEIASAKKYVQEEEVPDTSSTKITKEVKQVKFVKNDSTKQLNKEQKQVVEKEEKKETPIAKINEIISLGKILWSIIIILIGYFIINLLIKIADSLAERKAKYRFTFKSLIPIIKIIGWALVTTAVIAGVFQPPFETVIAVTASVGIAVGFAAQDILKNIFGGIMIVFDRPFQVGDKIEIGEYYGEVVEIGLRSTRIVTKDDSLVSVPNSEAVNNAVSNSNSGESNCQVVAEIWLPIDLDTSKARAIALESAQVSPYVYLNKPITILFINEVKEQRSYLKMRVKAYVSDTRNEFIFMSDVTERVIKELLRQGIVKKEDLF
jgi:small-conductance mechanosensitive channel